MSGGKKSELKPEILQTRESTSLQKKAEAVAAARTIPAGVHDMGVPTALAPVRQWKFVLGTDGLQPRDGEEAVARHQLSAVPEFLALESMLPEVRGELSKLRRDRLPPGTTSLGGSQTGGSGGSATGVSSSASGGTGSSSPASGSAGLGSGASAREKTYITLEERTLRVHNLGRMIRGMAAAATALQARVLADWEALDKEGQDRTEDGWGQPPKRKRSRRAVEEEDEEGGE